ncbi:hypothetical protein [Acutalibacter caecimuris]|uniref:hypothetical protein n=1 Tax=Acutalibacter caecimuris TaxID=3093657 RepID=UPI002AC9BAD6|nr:hypothetical protein [Acutalibacter sp. M00118]
MSKKNHPLVADSELVLPRILLETFHPLNKQEVLEKASADESMFAKKSFHLFANELISKGYLLPIDNGGIGRKNARCYAPTVPYNEF